MDLLLVLILAVVVYIAVTVRSMARGCQPTVMKGKFVQIEILIPARVTDRPPEVSYEVTQSGLAKTLEVQALVDFDSLGKKQFLIGDNLKVVCLESKKCDNKEALAALCDMRQNLTMLGILQCTPSAFDLILSQLSLQKPLIFRVPGYLLFADADGTRVAARTFEILVGNSAVDYFLKNYRKKFAGCNEVDREKLRFFNDRFNCHYPANPDSDGQVL